MNKYQNFIFKDYSLEDKKLILKYSLDDEVIFKEVYRFDFDFQPNVNEALLDNVLQSLFFMAGVSYYKTYLPPKIVVEKGKLDQPRADFFGKTYQRGLGEYFYLNRLDPNLPVSFPTNSPAIEAVSATGQDGLLVGIGGGKDSLVSVELLRSQPKVATWSVGHRSQLQPLVKEIGLPHFWVERTWDPKLLELNAKDAYNGHIPISAILGCVGAVVAVLTGYSDVVVSNESSASEPNLEYRGIKINHQYSKSLRFEKDFQTHLHNTISESIRYYSFLRPLTEVRIAEVFTKTGFDKYKDVFSSCNRSFTHDRDHMFWCGECPKCAFTFLVLTPFVSREELESLWGGKNLLLDPSLDQTYKNLLGIEGDKPLDCVGEVKESRAAMLLAQQQYPELSKYQFDIPADYDYRRLSPHSMPDELYETLIKQLEP